MNATFDRAAALPIAERPERRSYLFGPFVDFFCLGGSSLIYIPLL